MRIIKVEAYNIRNFQHFSIAPAANYNLIVGDNGSGKTSFLEAIYLLILSRSFRTHTNRRIIRNDTEKLSVFAVFEDAKGQKYPVGLEKNHGGETKLRLAGNNTSVAEVASLIPIRVLNNDSFFLITEGPKHRRQFIDWGLFHVKHAFMQYWRQYQQALKQRNALLKQNAAKLQINSWNNVLIEAAEAISELRKEYMDEFLPIFRSLVHKFLPLEGLQIDFKQGWPEDESLAEALDKAFLKDKELGYTYYGAHRADINIKFQKKPAMEMLSRGQQKVFSWIMLLAQGILLKQAVGKDCIYLVDDLPSELDATKRRIFINELKQLDSQIFITGIYKNDLQEILKHKPGKMFHVEHDGIQELPEST